MTRTRFSHLDIAKAIGILAVIFAHVTILFAVSPPLHSAQAFVVSRDIYAWHMPLFFLLSGIFHSRKGPRAACVSALTFILLAILTEALGIGLSFLVTNDLPRPISVVQTVVLLRGFTLGVTWFLVALAFAKVLFSLVTDGGPLAKIGGLALAGLSLAATLVSDTTLFQIQAVWAAFLMYGVGFAARSFLKTGIPALGTPALLGLAVVSAALTAVLARLNLGCTFNPTEICGSDRLNGAFMVRMIAGQYGFIPYFLGAALSGSLMIIAVSALVDRALPESRKAPVLYVGQNTLALFLLNGCFLVVGNHVLRGWMPALDEGWHFLWVAVGVVLLHLALLPVVRPVTTWLERLCARIAATIIRAIPLGATGRETVTEPRPNTLSPTESSAP